MFLFLILNLFFSSLAITATLSVSSPFRRQLFLYDYKNNNTLNLLA
jgi:hypothetical protein